MPEKLSHSGTQGPRSERDGQTAPVPDRGEGGHGHRRQERGRNRMRGREERVKEMLEDARFGGWRTGVETQGGGREERER